MVERLEWLDYGAENRRKVVLLRPDFAIRRLENSLCRLSSEWIPFSNKGRIRQRKEKDWLCRPRYRGILISTAPAAMGTF